MKHACYGCGAAQCDVVLALGDQPLANAYPDAGSRPGDEARYPLDLLRCTACGHVQVPAVVHSEAIFADYAYFSSYSTTWLAHAQAYVDHIIALLGLGTHSFVVEIASNDGYLLRNFVTHGVPCLGVEPAANVAQAAIDAGVPTEVGFWTATRAGALAEASRHADLIIGNNVFAHTPAPNDFLAGLKTLLKPEGVVTLEFPHLMRLIDDNQFDTIYHEHFSYWSLGVVEARFAAHGLRVWRVDELPTHGGSLRVYGCHAEATRTEDASVARVREAEAARGMAAAPYYHDFAAAAETVRNEVQRFFADAREAGERVVGYGAPAKGNTLLNFCGATPEDLRYTVDRNPHKQGKLLPGTRIPIHPVEQVGRDRPDYLFILPWNLREEIMGQMAHIRTWGGRFVVPIPEVAVYD